MVKIVRGLDLVRCTLFHTTSMPKTLQMTSDRSSTFFARSLLGNRLRTSGFNAHMTLTVMTRMMLTEPTNGWRNPKPEGAHMS